MLSFAQGQKQKRISDLVHSGQTSFFEPEIFIFHLDYKTAGVGKINLVSSDSHVPINMQYNVLIKMKFQFGVC